MREYAYQRNQEVVRGIRALADLAPSRRSGRGPARSRSGGPTSAALDGELLDRAAPVFTRLAIEQLLERAPSRGPGSRRPHGEPEAGPRARRWPWPSRTQPAATGGHHHHMGDAGPQLFVEPDPDARRPAQERWPIGSAGGCSSGRSTATSWRASAASWTGRCRCRAGRTSGPCRSRTGWTCWPPA